MIKMAKSKRQQLVSLVLGSAFVFAALWFGLVNTLQHSLGETDDLIARVKVETEKARRLAGLVDRFKADLTNATERLQDLEIRMATGDVYRWAIRTIQNFAAAARVEIVSLDPPHEQTWGILPSVPYPAATFSMSGTAYYHEFGKFLADLENSFPHLRVLRLELEPTHFGGASAEEKEKLTFKMELMILINSAPAQP